MRRSVAAAFVLMLATESMGRAQESIPTDVLQKVKAASVFIEVTLGPLEYSGSGFVIHAEGDSVLIVTNAHVVAKPDLDEQLPIGLRFRERLELQRIKAAIQNLNPKVDVVFRSGTPEEQVVAAEIVVQDTKQDLAILKATKVKSVPAPISMDDNFHPVETTLVYSFGFPFGEALSKTKGNPAITVGKATVSSIRKDEQGEVNVIQIDGTLNPGNSGGPVVDIQGRLVGVAVATIRGAGIGFAIPPRHLQKLLSGGVSKVEVTSKKDNADVVVEIQIELVDPFHRIRKAGIECALVEKSIPTPDATSNLQGTRLNLDVVAGKGKATWRIPQPAGDKSVLLLQAILVDVEGHERRLSTTRHALPWSGFPSQANGIPIRRGLFSLMRPVLDEIRCEEILNRLKRSDPESIQLALQELSHFDPGPRADEIGLQMEKLLLHQLEGIRASAVKLIAVWGTKDKATDVLKLLEDPFASVRHATMETLAIWKTEEAIDPIVSRLTDTEDRRPARLSLIRLGNRCENRVIVCLGAKDLAVRLVACEILGEIGSQEVSIPALKKLATLETGLAVVRAKEAIDRIQSRASSSSPHGLVPFGDVDSRKVHLGLSFKQGEMQLTEGAFILSNSGSGLGLGLVQTGPDSMEFTYVALIRLPKGNLNQATFASRRKKQNQRMSVVYTAHLGDETLTFERFFAVDKLPFDEEEIVIQGKRLDPKNGRLLLADLSGGEPVILQKRLDLPDPGALTSMSREFLMDVSDTLLDEFIQKDEDVRNFYRGKRLIESRSEPE